MLYLAIRNEMIQLGLNNKVYDSLIKRIKELTISDLIEHANNVSFERDLDEAYAKGILDFSFEILDEIIDNATDYYLNDLAMAVYDLLWNRLELILSLELKDINISII